MNKLPVRQTSGAHLNGYLPSGSTMSGLFFLCVAIGAYYLHKAQKGGKRSE